MVAPTQFRIQLGDYGYNLFKPGDRSPRISGRFGAGELGSQNVQQETPRIYDDFGGGMGSAYRFIPNTYAWGQFNFNRTPRMWMPAGKLTEVTLPSDATSTITNGGGEISAGEVWREHLYLTCGRYLLRIDNKTTLTSTGGGIIYDRGSGRQLVDLINYQDILFLSQKVIAEPDNWTYKKMLAWRQASNAYVESPGPSPPPGNSVVYAEHFGKVWWETKTVGGYRILTNPTPYGFMQIEHTDVDVILNATAWDGEVAVGDKSSKIRNIVTANRKAWFPKDDGVYDVLGEGTYSPNITPYYEQFIHPFNGKMSCFHDGFLFNGTARGIDRVDVASNERLDVPGHAQPGYFMANETPVSGIPMASAVDGGWLMVALWNGTDSFVVAGKDRQLVGYRGPGPMVWHGAEVVLRGMRITWMMATSSDTGNGESRLWIGAHDGTKPRLFWQSLSKSGNPLQDYWESPGTQTHSFATESILYLPIEDWENANAFKLMRRVEIQSDNLTILETGASRGQIDLFASVDRGSRVLHEDGTEDDTNWIAQGSSNTSPVGNFVPTDDAISGHQVALMLKGRLTNPTNPEKHPFIVRSVNARAEVLVDQLESRGYTVIIADNSSYLGGGKNQRNPIALWEYLVSLQRSGPIIMKDEMGQELKVKVEPGVDYDLMPEREGQPWSIVARFVVTILGRPFWWDTNKEFDDIYFWG
jgi:hypothetical protein